MVTLPDMKCPYCRASIGCRANTFHSVPTATSYKTCLRRCERCGVGFSNAKDPQAVKIIHEEPWQNVPPEVQGGLSSAFDNALNEVHRRDKKDKFCSESSEDAVTWTVFRGLQRERLLGWTLAKLGLALPMDKPDEPVLLLWGAPVPESDERAKRLRDELIEVCKALGEEPKSLSEPDVVLDFGGEGLMFIEVKCSSRNDVKKDSYCGWDRYLDGTEAFRREAERVKRTGLYELARNWRIAWDLAGDRPMALMNLGPGKLFADKNGESVADFAQCLNLSAKRQFLRGTWRDLLGAIPSVPGWLWQFLADRLACEFGENGPLTGARETRINIPEVGTITFTGPWDNGRVKFDIPERLQDQMAKAFELFGDSCVFTPWGSSSLLKERPYTKDWLGLISLIQLMEDLIPDYDVIVERDD